MATPCTQWSGTINDGGYARIWKDGRSQSVHKVVWEAIFGPVHDDLVLDHLCRKRSCYNVDHLQTITQDENVLRGESPIAINARKTHCIRGHALWGDNLYEWIAVNGRHHRQCKTCRRVSIKKYRDRLKRERREITSTTAKLVRMNAAF